MELRVSEPSYPILSDIANDSVSSTDLVTTAPSYSSDPYPNLSDADSFVDFTSPGHKRKDAVIKEVSKSNDSEKKGC